MVDGFRALTKTCEYCGAGILRDLRKDRRFCSVACGLNAKKRAHRELNPRRVDGLSSTVTGCIAEMLIAADLLKRGYEVFRAISPTASCDLLICRAGQLLRVEVKTAYRQKAGVLMVGNYDPSKSDILAIYDRLTGTLTYRPAFDEEQASA